MQNPTREPEELRVGLTWAWERNDLTADYPAPTWTLTYNFKNAAQNFSFAATANGTAFLAARTAAQSGAFTAGTYDWVATVSDGTNVREVGRGTLKLLPSFTASGNYDNRTHAKKMLDALEAALEGTATAQQMDLMMLTIGVRMTQRDATKLLPLRDKYRLEVARQKRAENLAQGQADPNKIGVRFNRV